jgi:ubiquinone/menaquinone biosynthesis C-methylase UbiE
MPFLSPQQVIYELGLQPGMKVVDLGAGTGAYTLPAAKLVTEAGRVYAVEIQRDLLTRITSEAKDQGLTNIEILWGDIERPGGTKLATGLADVVIVANVLFQITDINGLITEIMRILKNGGRVLVIDWSDNKGIGPHPSMIVGEEKTKELFTGGGLELVKKVPSGDHHFGLIFKKP